MLTPRSTLARRVVVALDASPSRIPVLIGGCGSGRTTLLQQLRDRAGRAPTQSIDVERIATTPERFLRAVAATAPVPFGDASSTRGARAAFDATLDFFTRARTSGGEPVTFLLDEFLELRTFESFPGLRRVLHDFIDCISLSGNRFVLTSRYAVRALRLLRDRSARFEVIHMPGADGRGHARYHRLLPGAGRRPGRRVHRAERSGARRRTPRVRARAHRRAGRDARPRRRRRGQRPGVA